ncbi:hypothetical protein BUALT_Bualt14G0085800 [Buddleja alternifolia]|uniref:ATP-dependent DNA helicase n=1 Tax=Buddleja alternifolia TaxID=168488 RepID=A0AAV6WJ66_9LAMI|nr:hypothetical protein BUALT_Bualt14G0085800 [Buddleja alternifolia]
MLKTQKSIQSILDNMGKSIHSYDLPDIPIDMDDLDDTLPRQIFDELSVEIPPDDYDAQSKLNTEQQKAFTTIIEHCVKTNFQDFTGIKEPFGGKVVVLGGDFRLVVPVVPKATVQQTIDASLARSFLYKRLKRLTLSKNMRARSDPTFSEFLLRVGNGTELADSNGNIQIPQEMLIKYDIDDGDASEQRLIDAIFPSLLHNATSASYMTSRAILACKNEYVDKLNDRMISIFPGQAQIFNNFDEAIDNNESYYDPEFLNSLTPNGMPPHKLVLKKNCPIMLLRNLDPADGLCNGTRMVCKNFENNVIHAEIVVGQYAGKQVFIPRIPLSPAENEGYPFVFKRKQFPVRLCFAMTINKSQGQTIPYVGVYLPKPVFSHGQLYVALSRGTSMSTTKVLIKPDNAENTGNTWTRNVVYKEVLSGEIELNIQSNTIVTEAEEDLQKTNIAHQFIEFKYVVTGTDQEQQLDIVGYLYRVKRCFDYKREDNSIGHRREIVIMNNETVMTTESGIECRQCKKDNIEAIPRFRITLMVSANNEFSKITLFEEVATVYIGCSITNYIKSTNEIDTSKCIKDLEATETKEYKFLFKLDKNVELKNGIISIVADAVDCPDKPKSQNLTKQDNNDIDQEEEVIQETSRKKSNKFTKKDSKVVANAVNYPETHKRRKSTKQDNNQIDQFQDVIQETSHANPTKTPKIEAKEQFFKTKLQNKTPTRKKEKTTKQPKSKKLMDIIDIEDDETIANFSKKRRASSKNVRQINKKVKKEPE